MKLEHFKQISDVSIRARGASHVDLDALRQEFAVDLPTQHRSILEQSNGLESNRGFFRLFGLNDEIGLDLLWWNRPGVWRFAWGGRCEGYLFFGETAMGDQYAYAVDELRKGLSVVHFFEATSMEPFRLAGSFEEFWAKEWMANANQPIDPVLKEIMERRQTVKPRVNLVFAPSPLISGVEDLESVIEMPANVAMVCNGDIRTQIEAAPETAILKGVVPYTDELGRGRMRLLWS